MRCILSENNDPYFNLAAEEYFLHNRTDDHFLLWISEPTVISGKHQVIPAEIDTQFVYRNNIHVARRLSGGGTVYHDKGNLNFSFITSEEPGRLIDFSRYTLPIIRFLASCGIPAVFGGKNDILAGAFKLSGNAGHVYKNRVLHHGTLLFDADLAHLQAALAGHSERYSSRAVSSNPARVVNIARLLIHPLPIEEFTSCLFEFVRDEFKGQCYVPDPEEIFHIQELAAKKYTQWDWIYGYSPEYSFENEFGLEKGIVKVRFCCQKGIISDFKMQSDLIATGVCDKVSEKINGCRHLWADLLQVVMRLNLPGIAREKAADIITPNLF
jgi:lipoate---protein ligase